MSTSIQKLRTRIAQFLLAHMPSLWFEIASLLLLSFGVNVILASGGREHETLSFLSGAALVIAGAFSMFLKHKADMVSREYEATLAAEVPMRSEKFSSFKSVVDTHVNMTDPSNGNTTFYSSLILCVLFLFGGWGVYDIYYVGSNVNTSTLVNRLQVNLSKEIETLGGSISSGLDKLSQDSSNAHQLLIQNTEIQYQAISLELAGLREELNNLSAREVGPLGDAETDISNNSDSTGN